MPSKYKRVDLSSESDASAMSSGFLLMLSCTSLSEGFIVSSMHKQDQNIRLPSDFFTVTSAARDRLKAELSVAMKTPIIRVMAVKISLLTKP